MGRALGELILDMKVIFLNPVGIMGGAERVLLTMLTALQQTDPNLELYLIIGSDGLLAEHASSLGIKVTVLPLPKMLQRMGDSALKKATTVGDRLKATLMLLWQVGVALPAVNVYCQQLRQIIRQINPDLIHSNGIKTHLLIGLSGSQSIPVIWHIHDFYSTRPFMAKVLRWVSRQASVAIAISQAVAADVQATLPGLPVKVIYNSVDIEYFSPGLREDEGRRRELFPFSVVRPPSSSPSPIRIGLVATFARWKGHDVFLDAAAQIVNKRPDLDVQFYIVGGAIYETKGSQFSEQELQEKVRSLDIADKVEFLGFQPNIADIYRGLDIVVHASTQPEPFGLVIAEAMACGRPVIVSQAGGAAELFTDGEDAIGVEPGNSIALALAMQQLVDNAAQRQSLSKNARATALKQFDSDRLGQQILTTYLTLWH
jgi:glycosyltransferase involved in cell wall biosynthesis